MAEQVNMSVVKPDELNSTPQTCMVEGENGLLRDALGPPHMHVHTYTK